jgi:hypothetical protein
MYVSKLDRSEVMASHPLWRVVHSPDALPPGINGAFDLYCTMNSIPNPCRPSVTRQEWSRSVTWQCDTTETRPTVIARYVGPSVGRWSTTLQDGGRRDNQTVIDLARTFSKEPGLIVLDALDMFSGDLVANHRWAAFSIPAPPGRSVIISFHDVPLCVSTAQPGNDV